MFEEARVREARSEVQAFDLADDLSCVDAADEQLDPRQLRRALGQFATGVAIATTRCGGQLTGVTINSFSSVSLEPPLVLWSLQSNASSLQSFLRSGRYAINVLSADQQQLAAHFASRRPEKFAGVDIRGGLEGCPLIPGCLAYFECRLAERIPCGDHVVLLGAVERASHRDGEPLLFASGSYGVARSLAT